jgi:hypothetical protein
MLLSHEQHHTSQELDGVQYFTVVVAWLLFRQGHNRQMATSLTAKAD